MSCSLEAKLLGPVQVMHSTPEEYKMVYGEGPEGYADLAQQPILVCSMRNGECCSWEAADEALLAVNGQ